MRFSEGMGIEGHKPSLYNRIGGFFYSLFRRKRGRYPKGVNNLAFEVSNLDRHIENYKLFIQFLKRENAVYFYFSRMSMFSENKSLRDLIVSMSISRYDDINEIDNRWSDVLNRVSYAFRWEKLSKKEVDKIHKLHIRWQSFFKTNR